MMLKIAGWLLQGTRAIELNPNFAKVYNNRAAAQRELENLDKQ